MNKWFRYVGVLLFSALFGVSAHAQNCVNIPSLSADFEGGWEGWTGAITADVLNGPTGAAWAGVSWQECPYQTEFRPGWGVVSAGGQTAPHGGWCLKGPGGYSTSATSAVLDLTCPLSASYVEGTLTSPQIDLSAICDPSLPPPTVTFDFSYIELFTTSNSPGMYLEVTPDINDANPTWIVAENFPSLATLAGTDPVNYGSNIEDFFGNITCDFFNMPQPTSQQWKTISVKLPSIVQTSQHAAIRFRIYDQPFSDNVIGATLSGISPVYIDNISLSGYFNQDIAASKIGSLADSSVVQPTSEFTPTMRVRQVGNVLYNGSGATCTYQIYPLGNPNALLYNQTKLLTTAFSAQCTETPDISFSLTNPTVTQAPGEYTLRAIVSDSGWDCNLANDTLTNDLVVGFDYDVKPLVFIQPVNSRVSDIVTLPQTPEVIVRNIGLNDVSGFRVYCYVYDPTGQLILNSTPYVVGSLPSGKIVTATFDQFTPSTSGTYTLKCITSLGTDENRHNDTLIETRQYYWKYDVKADSILVPKNPLSGAYEVPQGGTYIPECRFENNGAEFVANVPIYFQAWKLPITAGEKPEYQSVNFPNGGSIDTLPELNVQDGMRLFRFNSNPGYGKAWIPLHSGLYKLVMFSDLYNKQFPDFDDKDPSNDTVSLVVSSIPPLQGTYQIGFGRDIPTLAAAIDSLNYRGVGGNVTFQLMDNNYTLSSDLAFFPVRGAGANARITFTPGAGKSPVITLMNGARIVMAANADYIGFNGSNVSSGTPDRALTIIQTYSGSPAFYVTRGSSFDEVHNSVIKTPIVAGATAQKAVQTSIGIWQENEYPPVGSDTLASNNNVYDNNDIEGFRTGIWMQGLAPAFVAGPGKYFYRFDSNCVVKNNYIANCSRAGIVGVNQYGITVYGNEVTNFYNASTNACGAMADEDAKVLGIGLGGVRARCDQPFDRNISGPVSPNLDSAKGYVVNAQVYNNKIHDLTADTTGAFGAVGIEVIEDTVWANALGAPSTSYTPGLHPTVTHNVVWNNMIWNLNAGNSRGDVRGILWDARGLNDPSNNTLNEYFTTKDSIVNNTIWISGNTTGTAIAVDLGHALRPMVWDNIMVNDAIAATKYMISYTVQDPVLGNLDADRNLYWWGTTSSNNNILVNEQILDANGNYRNARTYATLQEWQAGSQNDQHSLYGNPQFKSMTSPVDLHISSTVWSPAWENGGQLAGSVVKTDIDGDVRGLGGLPYDIGADEFPGKSYSSDLAALELVSPTSSGGIRLVTNPVNVQATIKNEGTAVQLQRKINIAVYHVISPGNETLVYEDTLLVDFKIGEVKNVTFGQNQTWGDFAAQNGSNYHIVVTTEPDNNLVNDTAQTYQQFFVQQQTVVVSCNTSTPHGLADYDSVAMALNALGVRFDAIDRALIPRLEDISYAPWATLIYCVENGTGVHPTGGNYTYALSYDERQQLKNFLNMGSTNLRRSLIIAGMNVASLHDQSSGDEAVVDTDLTRDYLHIRYIGTPTSAPYQNPLTGVRIEPTVQEYINAQPGDVINALRPNTVKNGTAEYAYYYDVHTNLPARVDTAAGVTFWGQPGVKNYNVIAYGFDWRHLARLANDNSSGITRVMLNSLQFILSHNGLIVPVELVTFNANRDGHDVAVTWTTASEKGVTQFNVERKTANATGGWTLVANGSVTAKGTPASGADYAVRDYSLQPGVYDYRLAEVYSDGHTEYSNTQEVVMPGAYALYQNYPNPFNTSTTNIEYQLQDAGSVKLVLYDVMGRAVRTLVDGMTGAGDHVYTLDATTLPSGTYYYRIEVNGFTQIRQMMIMK